ncbi:hypothetical protein ABFX02_13G080800 [Erythranthe guttata]
MDESWRMRMGMPTAPPPQTRHMPEYAARRSTEDAASHRRKPISDDPLNPEDFNDVFGGPPRTILSRQFSTGFSRSSSSSTTFSYEEIFRPSDKSSPATRKSGRSLPEFMIPGQTRKTDQNNQNKRQNKGFYSDIFGLEDDQRVVRSRSRSKASSSSVLSSEELSPLRPPFDYDVSFFASKLRPINVRSEWTSKRTGMGHEKQQQQQHMSTPPFAGRQPFYGTTENNCPDNLRSYPFGLNRKNSSPETISMEPISNNSYRFSADDLELVNSPSSPVSSICQSSGKEQKSCFPMEEVQDDDDDDDDDVMSSYVIEINSENREGTCESNGVDEAIAWAREKFQSQYSTEDLKTMDGHRVSMGQTESYYNSLDEQLDKFAAKEETQQFECTLETELQILDEQIRLWSSGKESDIRLLLSSLHQILWPESGWLAVPLSYIIEISQVKKAYQKARLCLHPDKLQQRGATEQQKYIADKAFYLLQDAWSAFISQDVF